MRLLNLAWITVLSFGAGVAYAADPVAGGVQAQTCKGCHGAQGVSVIGSIPSLAGQKDNFLQWQLVFFRSGRRANPIMGPLSANLTDEDVRNLGAYFASLPAATPHPAVEPAVVQAGADIAAQHHCAACHTDTYTGSRAAPAVAHQQRDYLAKALTDYRSGARPSVGVAAMTEAASSLSDTDIAALADYLATFQ